MIELSGYVFSVLREARFTLYRGHQDGFDPMLLVATVAEDPTFESVKRLEREFALRDDLDSCWAARPVALTRYRNRPALVLEDPGGVPLDGLLGQPLDVSQFLAIAVSFAAACRRMHERKLIHKDIKPANAIVDAARGVRLTGFGIASRLLREHQGPAPPGVIAGTLAYMAPEQTGRMNRSIDSRSDLSLPWPRATFYEMLTGAPPFGASDPMELIHCHIARQPIPPHERIGAIPEQISSIVMKLLAKTMEERYQTAAGVEVDLRRCLTEWESAGAHRCVRIGCARRLPIDCSSRNGCTDVRRELETLRSPRSIVSSPTAYPSWCSCPDIPASASRRWSTSCTRPWFRRAACSPPENSISSNATFPTPPWLKLFRA